jgi:hypothetical protein
VKQSARGEKGDALVGVDNADQFIDDQDLEAARDAVVSTRSKTKRKLEQGPETPSHSLRPRPVNPVYCGGMRWLEVFRSHRISI